MEQPSLITGLFRDEPAHGGAFKDRLDLLWQDTLANGYNFTLINISKELGKIPSAGLSLDTYRNLQDGAFSRNAHSALTGNDWRSFGGMMTNLPTDGLDDEIVNEIFLEAANWAKYLGLHSLCLDLGKLVRDGNDQAQPLIFYTETIARLLQKTVYEGFQFWLKTPWNESGWELWNELRNSIGENAKNRLHVVVDLTGTENIDDPWSTKMQRWYGESIQAISIPTSLFRTENSSVTLPSSIQTICKKFSRYPEVKWLIEGPCSQGIEYSAYRNHLDKILAQHPFSELELLLKPNLDYLQRPMQPLQDQLHSSNYELFEKDPVKYAQYEKAIHQALLDHHNEDKTVTLMVLGAGRGPLVDAALRASHGLPCKLKVFVIEKNPPAVVTLKHRMNDDWSDHDVQIVDTDMRLWQSDEKADIIVSELLGSWGDNELSPECLDGAQHLLNEDGISIPCRYTSYIAPISSARLHAYTSAQAPFMFPDIGNRKFLESTYVVLMGSIFQLSEEKPCFTFSHPSKDLDTNERHASCCFKMPENLSNCIIHGFRGTFDCQLYGNIHISIADSHYSDGMFCWFPLYIPLQHPLNMKGGDEIEALVWRRSSNTKVWYEWAIKDRTHIHNYGGRSSTIGLY